MVCVGMLSDQEQPGFCTDQWPRGVLTVGNRIAFDVNFPGCLYDIAIEMINPEKKKQLLKAMTFVTPLGTSNGRTIIAALPVAPRARYWRDKQHAPMRTDQI